MTQEYVVVEPDDVDRVVLAAEVEDTLHRQPARDSQELPAGPGSAPAVPVVGAA